MLVGWFDFGFFGGLGGFFVCIVLCFLKCDLLCVFLY